MMKLSLSFFLFIVPPCYAYCIDKAIRESLHPGKNWSGTMPFLGELGEELPLGVEDKVELLLFNAVQKTRRLKSTTVIPRIFIRAGVYPGEYEQTLASREVAEMTEKQKDLFREYSVTDTPSVYVNGRYRIENSAFQADSAEGFHDAYTGTVKRFLSEPGGSKSAREKMNIWLTGLSTYEIAGVEALLADKGIKGRIFCRGDRLMKGDSLILCFSETPLLGWWRWLRLIQWLSARYGVWLIVLCPSAVYSMEIIRGKNIVPVNGEQAKKALCDRLCSVLCGLQNERVAGIRGRNVSSTNEHLKNNFDTLRNQTKCGICLYPTSKRRWMNLTIQRYIRLVSIL